MRLSSKHAMSVNLGPEQLTEKKRKQFPAIAGAVACSKDRVQPAR
jgi:hypothetical protein